MTSTGTTPMEETAESAEVNPRLSDRQIGLLAASGERRRVGAGDLLFREGDPCGDIFVVLEGEVDVVEDYGGDEEVVARHGPRQLIGELGLLEGQFAFVSAVAREPGEVIAVAADALRGLVAGEPRLGDLILRAYLMRRSLLIGRGAGFRIIGSQYSPDSRRLLEFAARNRLPHRWMDLEKDAEAETLLRRLGVPAADTPVAVLRGNEVLRNPSNAELARLLGLRTTEPATATRDLLVVGAGPAGLAAAVYGASDGFDVTALDETAAGGQAGTSSRIENYLGFPAGVAGQELADRAVLQAIRFGARINVPVHADALERHGNGYRVRFDDGTSVTARGVVLATGAHYRRLEVPGVRELEGLGVHYAATVWEARTCPADPVAVVGGGNSAGQAAVFLAGQLPLVHLLVRGDDLEAGMSRYLVQRIQQHPRVDVRLRTEVREVRGSGGVESIVVGHNATGETRELPVGALFIFIGATPHTSWLSGEVALDGHGFVLTGQSAAAAIAEADWRHLGRGPLALETSLPGVFAAGDVRSGSVKRVASAIGEGSMAVRLLNEHLREERLP